MKFNKIFSFVIFLLGSFFMLGVKVNAVEEFFYSGDVNIYFSESLENEDDNHHVYIELMVLRSDFEDDQINNMISQEYKDRYPDYQNFTHLENGDEISYFAYIKGAHLYRNKMEFRFVDDYGYYKNITKIRMIIFDADGEVLATSELFDHVNQTRFHIVRGQYSASYDDLSFSNTRHHVFNGMWIVIWVLIFAISFFILLMKYLLEVIFGIRYKKFLKSLLFDSMVIFIGAYSMHFLNETFIPATLTSLLMMSISLFILMNVFDVIYFINKKSRIKYIIASVIHFVPIFLILKFMVLPWI